MWRDPALRPLSHQHQHGLALTVVLQRALQADASPQTVRRLAEDVLRMWQVELAGHFQVEEELLFPAVREALAEPGLLDALIGEHRRIERLVDALRAEPTAEGLAELASLLAQHIRAEERSLFQQIQQALTPEAIADLGARLDAAVAKLCPVTSGLPWQEPPR
ncbi:MAG: hypothetical protein GC160_25875 [Acidobacteria bacterium]|nr:hypothetical protein [Acidobacteriota bacterium]